MKDRDDDLIIKPESVAETLAIVRSLEQKGFTAPEAASLFELSERINAKEKVENALRLMQLRIVRRDVKKGIYNEGY